MNGCLYYISLRKLSHLLCQKGKLWGKILILKFTLDAELEIDM